MEEMKLSEDVFEQIKDFDIDHLTKEQELLIDQLILNRELKKRYKTSGICKECKQLNTGSYYSDGHYYWCRSCNGKHFQQNFQNLTSGNHDIDKLIRRTQLNAKNHREVIEWIEYDRFENIAYLAEGGFGTIYKATWKDGFIYNWDSENNQWNRKKYYNEGIQVALQNITEEFLREVESYTTLNYSYHVIQRYGITKDPETNNFMMVMDYASGGNLRQHLNKEFNGLTWYQKLNDLLTIAAGLAEIHDKQLIHRGFHCGNILSITVGRSSITALRLCEPANKKSEETGKQIYGVLPYVAPEVLRGKECTQASDVYGLGIIAYELCTGNPPYHDVGHEENLAIRICNGQRPNSNYKIPQLILDVIKKCWDADPLKRPSANESKVLFWDLLDETGNSDSTINKQIEEADEINDSLPSSSRTGTLSYTTHPQAIYTSRLLDFKNLPEPKNSDNETNYSGN